MILFGFHRYFSDLVSINDLVKVRDGKMTLSGDMFSLANVRVLIDSFDCIHRPSLWLILRQYGIPDSIVTIIQSVYKSSKVRNKEIRRILTLVLR